MIKKFGVVTVGVAAGLMVAAPFASAHEASGSEGGHQGSADCSFVGGTGEGSSSGDATGSAAVTGATAGGLGGDNIGNIADCSTFLNDNLNGNQLLSNNTYDGGDSVDIPIVDDGES